MNEELEGVERLIAELHERMLQEWLDEIAAARGAAAGRLPPDLRDDARDLLSAFRHGLRGSGDAADVQGPRWEGARDVLNRLSRAQAERGGSVGETSRFVLALKKPLFSAVQQHLAREPARLGAVMWNVSTLVDRLAQYTADTYQRTREDIIARQQREILELSTPVVKLWEGVLAVPMIGTLDSGRTQHVMESLLQRIVDTGSEIAIIDITGVPTVDTLVAQHLLKTVTAIRLMGAECIVSGVRPQIAQTIVHLGIDLQGITTKATLADALSLAMKRLGWSVRAVAPQ